MILFIRLEKGHEIFGLLALDQPILLLKNSGFLYILLKDWIEHDSNFHAIFFVCAERTAHQGNRHQFIKVVNFLKASNGDYVLSGMLHEDIFFNPFVRSFCP